VKNAATGNVQAEFVLISNLYCYVGAYWAAWNGLMSAVSGKNNIASNHAALICYKLSNVDCGLCRVVDVDNDDDSSRNKRIVRSKFTIYV
jgi:hypothetical protein